MSLASASAPANNWASNFMVGTDTETLDIDFAVRTDSEELFPLPSNLHQPRSTNRERGHHQVNTKKTARSSSRGRQRHNQRLPPLTSETNPRSSSSRRNRSLSRGATARSNSDRKIKSQNEKTKDHSDNKEEIADRESTSRLRSRSRARRGSPNQRTNATTTEEQRAAPTRTRSKSRQRNSSNSRASSKTRASSKSRTSSRSNSRNNNLRPSSSSSSLSTKRSQNATPHERSKSDNDFSLFAPNNNNNKQKKQDEAPRSPRRTQSASRLSIDRSSTSIKRGGSDRGPQIPNLDLLGDQQKQQEQLYGKEGLSERTERTVPHSNLSSDRIKSNSHHTRSSLPSLLVDDAETNNDKIKTSPRQDRPRRPKSLPNLDLLGDDQQKDKRSTKGRSSRNDHSKSSHEPPRRRKSLPIDLEGDGDDEQQQQQQQQQQQPQPQPQNPEFRSNSRKKKRSRESNNRPRTISRSHSCPRDDRGSDDELEIKQYVRDRRTPRNSASSHSAESGSDGELEMEQHNRRREEPRQNTLQRVDSGSDGEIEQRVRERGELRQAERARRKSLQHVDSDQEDDDIMSSRTDKRDVTVRRRSRRRSRSRNRNFEDDEEEKDQQNQPMSSLWQSSSSHLESAQGEKSPRRRPIQSLPLKIEDEDETLLAKFVNTSLDATKPTRPSLGSSNRQYKGSFRRKLVDRSSLANDSAAPTPPTEVPPARSSQSSPSLAPLSSDNVSESDRIKMETNQSTTPHRSQSRARVMARQDSAKSEEALSSGTGDQPSTDSTRSQSRGRMLVRQGSATSLHSTGDTDEQERLEKAKHRIQSMFQQQRSKEHEKRTMIRLGVDDLLGGRDASLHTDDNNTRSTASATEFYDADELEDESTESEQNIETGLEIRRRKVYYWYSELGMPEIDTFKAIIREMGVQTVGISEEDCELLPWSARESSRVEVV